MKLRDLIKEIKKQYEAQNYFIGDDIMDIEINICNHDGYCFVI